MDINALTKMRHELLEELVEDLNDNLTAAGIIEVTTEDEPEAIEFILTDIANSTDEARGYIYFNLPQTEEDEVQHLTCMFDLFEDLPKENLPALYEALNYINFAIPYGAFSVDVGNRFVTYKLCVPLDIQMEKDELYEELTIVAGNAAEAVSSFFTVISNVLYGTWDIEKVADYLGGRPEE